MKAGLILRAAFAGAFLTFLASCESGGVTSGDGFRKQYTVARTALEEGRYDVAIRHYQRMIPNAGRAAPRLQLEYAHAQLRAGDYAGARVSAGTLAQEQSGDARLAALAVAGTAAHELGLAARQSGDPASAKALLTEAQSAMAEVVNSNPDLDPLGALSGRLASIKVQLAAL
ncbi:tetratricopeptide repeat protein [Shimia biformata]|uniref:tetratricopeptide repeat protein n=1 Tax=Shimia biformata TaxID=1294299 RepID=UPI00194F12A3|nr:tetratricopeptide repeat protein [Shimia biformata]